MHESSRLSWKTLKLLLQKIQTTYLSVKRFLRFFFIFFPAAELSCFKGVKAGFVLHPRRRAPPSAPDGFGGTRKPGLQVL
jgi:hypothetical protein